MTDKTHHPVDAVNTAPISADLRGIEKEARECLEPETVVVGAMHRFNVCASFADDTQCVNCGAQQDEFSKPCSAFTNEAAAARAAIEGALWSK